MGGEGSMSYANMSLKQNRSLLRNRGHGELRDLLKAYADKSQLEFKKISPKELEIIKAQIRRDAKKEVRKQIIGYVISGIITLTILLIIII